MHVTASIFRHVMVCEALDKLNIWLVRSETISAENRIVGYVSYSLTSLKTVTQSQKKSENQNLHKTQYGIFSVLLEVKCTASWQCDKSEPLGRDHTAKQTDHCYYHYHHHKG
jgi:hypothetical protein